MKPDPKTPLIDAVVERATPEVETVNEADCDPAAMVTVVGGVALALFEIKLTIHPPTGAFAFRFTVPVTELPPVTLFGAKEIPLSDAAWIENDATC